MNELILPLDSHGVTLGAGGGKGANLSRLIRGGFPVPPGFVITSAAYLDFLRENELAKQVIELAHSAHVGQPDSLEAASKSIRQLFDQAMMPTDVGRIIKASYARLGELTHGAPLAVRSSATAEDLPEASFAGQHETFLNVRGEAELLASVKRCWSSMWTARAIAYRLRQGIDPSAGSLAVVVQELIPAESAGVMFTANPVTGAQDEIIIEAAWGLGEAMVGGRVTPGSHRGREGNGEDSTTKRGREKHHDGANDDGDGGTGGRTRTKVRPSIE